MVLIAIYRLVFEFFCKFIELESVVEIIPTEFEGIDLGFDESHLPSVCNFLNSITNPQLIYGTATGKFSKYSNELRRINLAKETIKLISDEGFQKTKSITKSSLPGLFHSNKETVKALCRQDDLHLKFFGIISFYNPFWLKLALKAIHKLDILDEEMLENEIYNV